MMALLTVVVILLLLELGYFVAGKILMKGRSRVIVAILLLVVFAALEAVRYLGAAYLPAGFPLVFLIGMAGSLWGDVRRYSIGACDTCNWWIPPFGGSILGSSSGSPELLCLKCTASKWTLFLPIVLPFGKLRSSWFWFTRGLWRQKGPTAPNKRFKLTRLAWSWSEGWNAADSRGDTVIVEDGSGVLASQLKRGVGPT